MRRPRRPRTGRLSLLARHLNHLHEIQRAFRSPFLLWHDSRITRLDKVARRLNRDAFRNQLLPAELLRLGLPHEQRPHLQAIPAMLRFDIASLEIPDFMERFERHHACKAYGMIVMNDPPIARLKVSWFNDGPIQHHPVEVPDEMGLVGM